MNTQCQTVLPKAASSSVEHKSQLTDDIQVEAGHHEQTATEVPEAPEELEPAIIFENVGLCFRRSPSSIFSTKKRSRESRSFWALQDISFTVAKGESVGLVGKNGSGKSTMAQIIAGVYTPDTGQATVLGRAGLLALGVGFRAELSGIDNIYISASYLGLSKKEIREQLPEITTFCELGDFIYEPVRTYSNGMKARLGFAIATTVRPEILIIDEAMATGDQAFRGKAEARLKEMTAAAGTMIVVSHQASVITSLCDRAIWIDKGQMKMDGDAKTVMQSYSEYCSQK